MTLDQYDTARVRWIIDTNKALADSLSGELRSGKIETTDGATLRLLFDTGHMAKGQRFGNVVCTGNVVGNEVFNCSCKYPCHNGYEDFDYEGVTWTYTRGNICSGRWSIKTVAVDEAGITMCTYTHRK